MSSIFNQYQATQRESMNPFDIPSSAKSSQPVTSGYVNTRVADETPIFTKTKINYNPQEPITHLAINNNKLCMMMSGRTLLRIDLEKPENPEEAEITRGDDKVYKMFLDPTGAHLMLEMVSQDTVFLSKNSRKPKVLSQKFKGHKIESVGWDRHNLTEASNTATTGPILVGTSRGHIMECCIESGEDTKFFGGSVDQYVKQLFSLSKGDSKDYAITGLEFNPFPRHSSAKPTKYHILATTRTRLYQFVGRINPNSGEIPVFQNIFTPYDSGPPRFTDLPGGGGGSQLVLHYQPKMQTHIPTQFAWMASPGVYFGDISVPAVEDSTALHHLAVVANARLISYPDKGFDDSPFPPPLDPSEEVLAISITEFHLLIMYTDRVKAICTLNEQVVYEDVFSTRYGPILGLIKDETKGTVWAYTERAVYKYKIFNESRNVWQMFLNNCEFDKARDYCKDNPANLDKVFTRQAEYYFEQAKYNESALYFAMTRNSFEEIALKFVRANQEEALRAFLHKKLSSLKPAEKTQTTMLVTWLIELYLNQLGKLKEEKSETFDRIEDMFRKFLAQQNLKECLLENKKTIYDLLIGHGNIEDYVFFAVLMQDYERVITHHIQNEDYSAALDALRKQSNINLYYKFSPILMQYIPEQTVDAWISLGGKLEPKKLIPSLINSTQGGQMYKPDEAIRYLEHCTSSLQCTEPAIHNYLLSLYVKHKPEDVAEYIQDQGDILENICYDVKYALRLCLDGGVKLRKACVKFYTIMGLYEEAVTLALKVDVDIAKSIANRPELEEEDEELRKKLWMLIARHVVQEEKDIKRAMQFLQESGDLLKIEDILPFFPDFVTIDHFKDALCESLDEYNKHIKDLKDEMNESTESAHAIRADIQETRNHHLVVGGTDRCACCNGVLLSRGFYGFPCSHSFHSDCLWKEVAFRLPHDEQARAETLKKELNALNQPATSVDQEESTVKDRKRRRQELVFELDNVIATECAYCGEIAIDSVDEPFIEPENYEAAVNSWL